MTIPVTPQEVSSARKALFELYRIVPLLLVAALILLPDTGSFVVLNALGITVVVAAMSHIIRRILFSYISMRRFAMKALETSGGAAAVFASVSLILSVIIASTCALLK